MSIANLEGVETASPVATRQMRNAIVASVLGWSLDLFDLFILLYVAPVVGALFFPSSIPTLSLAAVYASFAVTLLMRPIGTEWAAPNRRGAMSGLVGGGGAGIGALLASFVFLVMSSIFPGEAFAVW